MTRREKRERRRANEHWRHLLLLRRVTRYKAGSNKWWRDHANKNYRIIMEFITAVRRMEGETMKEQWVVVCPDGGVFETTASKTAEEAAYSILDCEFEDAKEYEWAELQKQGWAVQLKSLDPPPAESE